MAIIRLITRWTGATVQGGGITQTYFGEADGTAQDAADALGTFWDSMEGAITNTLAWAMDAQVAIFDETDGSLQGATTVTPPGPWNGTLTGSVLPPASQGLVQWATADVQGNRFIRGHTFLPGMCEEFSTSAGVPQSDFVTAVTTAANALVADADSALVIWARPVGARPGQAGVVTQASVWSKWAVLRGRRD